MKNVCYNLPITKKIGIRERIDNSISNGFSFNGEKHYYLIAINSTFNSTNCYYRIKSDIDKKKIKLFMAGYVIAFDINDQFLKRDDWFLFDGNNNLFIDPLYENSSAGFIIRKDINNVFVVEIDCKDLEGNHHIEIDFLNERKELLCKSDRYNLEVLPLTLPESDLKVTHWFHYDCLMHEFGYKFMSKPYMKVLDKYVKEYVNEGNNTILTPMFTFCLDTQENHERTTFQLVKVYKNNGHYSFDFSLFEKFVSFMQERGIKYFELSHLFTQWGARHCPKIIINEDGKNKKCFGWKEDSTSKEYYDFLGAYLHALKDKLNEMDLINNVYMHISDEPTERNIDIYTKHYNFIKSIIPEAKIIDAVSETKFQNAMDIPVVTVDSFNDFDSYQHEKWAYYCCMQVNKYVPNALIGMPSLRVIALGSLLYVKNAKGFLQWGFNFYNSFLSKIKINPFAVTDCWARFPSGDGFLVYPNKENILIRSIRGIYLKQAFMDYRIIKLHESFYGKEKTMDLLHKYGTIDFETYSHDEKVYESMINELVANIISYQK